MRYKYKHKRLEGFKNYVIKKPLLFRARATGEKEI